VILDAPKAYAARFAGIAPLKIIFTFNYDRTQFPDGTTIPGFSGLSKSVNKPRYSNIPFVGPIPPGFYKLVGPGWNKKLGGDCYFLEPMKGTNLFDRYGFFSHIALGKSAEMNGQPCFGSEGCLVIPPEEFRHYLKKVRELGVQYLAVGTSQQLRAFRQQADSAYWAAHRPLVSPKAQQPYQIVVMR